MEELGNLLGFRPEYYEIPDCTGARCYGKMNSEGEWNGMIKEIVDKKADIGLGALSVMAEREEVLDFTVPFYDLVGITILMKRSKAPTSFLSS